MQASLHCSIPAIAAVALLKNNVATPKNKRAISDVVEFTVDTINQTNLGATCTASSCNTTVIRRAWPRTQTLSEVLVCDLCSVVSNSAFLCALCRLDVGGNLAYHVHSPCAKRCVHAVLRAGSVQRCVQNAVCLGQCAKDRAVCMVHKNLLYK